MGVLLLVLVLLIVVVIGAAMSNRTASSSSAGGTATIPVFYCTEIPQEAAAAAGLMYLQNNPGVTGHYLMDNVVMMPFATASELQSKLGTYIQRGGTIAVLTSGSQLLESTLPLVAANPQFELLNMYSTVPLSTNYDNLLRFAFSDDTTFPSVTNVIPVTTIVYYDPDYVWANESAIWFGNHGYTIIPYTSTDPLPEGVPYMIIATTLTPTLIDRVPASCPKLYGLDGSIFYPFTGATATKAATMQFQCVQYFPPITSPLIADVQTQVGQNFSYIFPTALDGIGYARLRLQGYSDNTIQTTTSGFSGSLIFTNGSRTYGNLEWYTYTGTWNLTSTVLISTNGSCTVDGV